MDFLAIALVFAHLRLQHLNLHLQRVVLFHLALEEPTGQRHLLGNALGGEQVDVLELVLALLEVAHLHKAFIDEGVEAVVQPGNGAVQEIHSGMGFYDADFGIVVTQSSYTEHAKSLANKLGIYLESVDTFVDRIKVLAR